MKVFLDSVGCRLNQAEIEQIGHELRVAGHELAPDAGRSDVVVINTCAVTSAAAADSRAKARKAWRRNPRSAIVLTGCWSTLEPAQAASLPGVASLVPNSRKAGLVQELTGPTEAQFDQEPLDRIALPGLRRRTRAFIKAQDGCNYRCAFCITTLARGRSRSVPVDPVVEEVRAAVRGGAKEVVLTGVALSSYGRDLGDRVNLVELVRAVLGRTGIDRLRLSSLEPWGLPAEFFELWEDPRLCRQLHLPLQSGSQSTLERMLRPMRPSDFAALVARARSLIPDLALTTDILVGFPGEREEEFAESLRFVEEMDFADAHIFTYSPRPGTLAERMPESIPPDVAKARRLAIESAVSRSRKRFLEAQLGKVAGVLLESASALGPDGWTLSGLTDNYVRVEANFDRVVWNEIRPVRLTGMRGGLVVGKPVGPSG